MKIRLFIVLFGLIPFLGNAQLFVNDQLSVQDMVKRLEGEGVVINNISSYYPLASDSLRSPVGAFTENLGVLGMESGLLMTNGAARNALGPNDRSDRQQVNFPDIFNDPDLEQLISPGQTLQDLCVIEFDISIYGDELSFNYVFASEEYPEFLDFNDVFGFFISGPGINGSENLAVLPGSNTPVSVSNVNHNVNTQYYIPNGTGSTPFDNSEMQYDGRTVKLRAQKNVIPCEVYHIKLAIADVDDSNLDSGVFLEEKSFNSQTLPNISIVYEHRRFNHLIEGCNDALVTIHREGLNITQPLTLDLTLQGSATERDDYSEIPDQVVFEPFQEEVSFPISAFLDAVDDPYEVITLILESQCDQFPAFDVLDIPIREKFEEQLPNQTKCGEGEVQLNTNPIPTDAYTWHENELLSCVTCPSPYTSITEDTIFTFDIYDSISGCPGEGTQWLDFYNVNADFDVVTDPCATSIDVDFLNRSSGADAYRWSFGDGSNSTAREPEHRYTAATNLTEAQTYVISLTVINAEIGCENTYSEEITILEPLYVPNVVTPNNDSENDHFTIRGINSDCWTFTVYNRWGKKVYEQSPFDNRFTPDQLADGTYFYTVESNELDHTLKGHFQIFK